MSNTSQRLNEFVVRVPKPSELKKFSVLKFNSNLKMDPTRWTADGGISMQREENQKTISGLPSVQDFGEGSEYGKAARDEARRKRLGRQLKKYSIDEQPWRMTAKDVDGRERKMHSIREGNTGKHADYWLFLKAGEEFLAYKVDDWHNFMPSIAHKTLDIDEAEERFQQRSRVMNQFALKAQIQEQLRVKEEGEEQALKASRGLKIKDEASSDESNEGGGEEEGEEKEEREKSKGRKKKKTKTVRKDKKQRVENGDEVARYESEDGEDEGREYDYMSDSGSDSGREDVPMEEKVEKALVAVGDEDGLKKMMNSDEESSDDDDLEKKVLNKKDDEEKKKNIDIEERDSSGSDSEDSDKEKIDSVVLMPKKEGGASSSPSSSATGAAAVVEAVQRKRAAVSEAGGADAKKAKTQPTTNTPANKDELSEEIVRKLLRSKPHTTKELLSKMKSRCGADLKKEEVVSRLAAILKKIEPHQFKQKQGKKEVLFFSLANTM